MKQTLYSLSEIEKIMSADILHHPFLHKPDFVKGDVIHTNVLMLGTVHRPHWRCKANWGKYRVGYCFGATLEEAKENALLELIGKWFKDSTTIADSEYARVMWM